MGIAEIIAIAYLIATGLLVGLLIVAFGSWFIEIIERKGKDDNKGKTDC